MVPTRGSAGVRLGPARRGPHVALRAAPGVEPRADRPDRGIGSGRGMVEGREVRRRASRRRGWLRRRDRRGRPAQLERPATRPRGLPSGSGVAAPPARRRHDRCDEGGRTGGSIRVGVRPRRRVDGRRARIRGPVRERLVPRAPGAPQSGNEDGPRPVDPGPTGAGTRGRSVGQQGRRAGGMVERPWTRRGRHPHPRSCLG